MCRGRGPDAAVRGAICLPCPALGAPPKASVSLRTQCNAGEQTPPRRQQGGRAQVTSSPPGRHPPPGADQVQGLLQTGPHGPEDLLLSAHVLMGETHRSGNEDDAMQTKTG